LPNGINLSDSVENEYYCLKLAEAFGLPVNQANMQCFGRTRALVIERFDRRWTPTGRLLRLPQEDCCQALSVAPTRKYQSDGGPGIVDVLTAQPSLDSRQITRKQLKLAMSVGDRRHYRIEEIVGRHFIQTGQEAGLPGTLVKEAIEGMADKAAGALEKTAQALPADFPASIHESVSRGVLRRVRQLTVQQ